MSHIGDSSAPGKSFLVRQVGQIVCREQWVVSENHLSGTGGEGLGVGVLRIPLKGRFEAVGSRLSLRRLTVKGIELVKVPTSTDRPSVELNRHRPSLLLRPHQKL